MGTKKGIGLISGIGLVAVILLLPGMSVTGTGGAFGGPSGIDPFFAGSWSVDDIHANDDQSGAWNTGVHIGDLSYKDATVQGDDLDMYADDIMIPWIGIEFNNNNNGLLPDERFPHCVSAANGGCDDDHMMLTAWQFNERNIGNPMLPTTLVATYNLDLTQNGQGVDFTINENIILSGATCAVNPNTIEMQIGIAPNPNFINNWMIWNNNNNNWDSITSIFFSYSLKAYVSNGRSGTTGSKPVACAG